MESFVKIRESLMSQGIIGWFFIGLTLLAVIYGIRSWKKINTVYNDLLRNFNLAEEKENDPTGEKIFDDSKINKMVSDFIKSVERGTENINTEVIIENNIGDNVIKKEETLKLLPSICIAFGLLGTFMGLTLAIIQTNGVLGNIGSMEEFSTKMQGPFSSMSSAFWTSIFGVASSVILNGLNNTIKNKKESFYGLIEDYLDNVVYGAHSKNFNKLFIEFNTTIKSTMIELTKEMRSLFQDGVTELVSKINKNTIDLTDTVKGLTDYTKDLDRLTKSLNTSVNNFKDPVDKFKGSVYEFTSIAEDLSVNMKESINKFGVKVDLLENNLSNLYNSIDGNKREIANIGISLKQQSDVLNNSYNNLSEVITSISNIQSNNTELLKEQIAKLNKGYEKFDNGLEEFIGNFETLQNKVSDGIVEVLNKEMEVLSKGIVERLDGSMDKVDTSIEQLATNVIKIGEIVKASNDLWTSVNKENY